MVVAVTNDFSWVQIDWKDGEVNAPSPAAMRVRVTWRKGHRLPETPPSGRLRAVEVISGQELTIEEHDRFYQVRLPRFQFMALLVVRRVPRGPRSRRLSAS